MGEWKWESCYRTPTDENPFVQGIDSLGQLNAALDEGSRRTATMHALWHPEYGVLSFGLGAARVPVYWIPYPGASPGRQAVGGELDGPEFVTFDYLWEEIMFESRDLLPQDIALAVIRHFFITGNLPDWIEWWET